MKNSPRKSAASSASAKPAHHSALNDRIREFLGTANATSNSNSNSNSSNSSNSSKSGSNGRGGEPCCVVGLVGNFQRRDSTLALLQHLTGRRIRDSWETAATTTTTAAATEATAAAEAGGSASSSSSRTHGTAAHTAAAAAGGLNSASIEAAGGSQPLQMFYEPTAHTLFLVSAFTLDLRRKVGALAAHGHEAAESVDQRRSTSSDVAAAQPRGAERDSSQADNSSSSSSSNNNNAAFARQHDALHVEVEMQFPQLAAMFSVCHFVYFIQDAGPRVPAFDMRLVRLLRDLTAFQASAQKTLNSALRGMTGGALMAKRKPQLLLVYLTSFFCDRVSPGGNEGGSLVSDDAEVFVHSFRSQVAELVGGVVGLEKPASTRSTVPPPSRGKRGRSRFAAAAAATTAAAAAAAERETSASVGDSASSVAQPFSPNNIFIVEPASIEDDDDIDVGFGCNGGAFDLGFGARILVEILGEGSSHNHGESGAVETLAGTKNKSFRSCDSVLTPTMLRSLVVQRVEDFRSTLLQALRNNVGHANASSNSRKKGKSNKGGGLGSTTKARREIALTCAEPLTRLAIKAAEHFNAPMCLNTNSWGFQGLSTVVQAIPANTTAPNGSTHTKPASQPRIRRFSKKLNTQCRAARATRTFHETTTRPLDVMNQSRCRIARDKALQKYQEAVQVGDGGGANAASSAFPDASNVGTGSIMASQDHHTSSAILGYSKRTHERAWAVAVAQFEACAGHFGPKISSELAELRCACNTFWEDGRRLCDATSITGRPCRLLHHRASPEFLIWPFNPRHRGNGITARRNMDAQTTADVASRHSSGFGQRSPCECGRLEVPRPDPFSMFAANQRHRANCCENVLHRLLSVEVMKLSTRPASASDKPAEHGSNITAIGHNNSAGFFDRNSFCDFLLQSRISVELNRSSHASNGNKAGIYNGQPVVNETATEIPGVSDAESLEDESLPDHLRRAQIVRYRMLGWDCVEYLSLTDSNATVDTSPRLSRLKEDFKYDPASGLPFPRFLTGAPRKLQQAVIKTVSERSQVAVEQFRTAQKAAAAAVKRRETAQAKLRQLDLELKACSDASSGSAHTNGRSKQDLSFAAMAKRGDRYKQGPKTNNRTRGGTGTGNGVNANGSSRRSQKRIAAAAQQRRQALEAARADAETELVAAKKVHQSAEHNVTRAREAVSAHQIEDASHAQKVYFGLEYACGFGHRFVDRGGSSMPVTLTAEAGNNQPTAANKERSSSNEYDEISALPTNSFPSTNSSKRDGSDGDSDGEKQRSSRSGPSSKGPTNKSSKARENSPFFSWPFRPIPLVLPCTGCLREARQKHQREVQEPTSKGARGAAAKKKGPVKGKEHAPKRKAPDAAAQLLYVVLPENASFAVGSHGGQDPQGDGEAGRSPRLECTVSLQVQCGDKFVQHVSIPGEAFAYVPEKAGHDSSTDDGNDTIGEQHWTLAPSGLASSVGGGIEPKLLAWRFPSIFAVPKDRNEDMEYFRAGATCAGVKGAAAIAGKGSDEAHNYDDDFFRFHPRNCKLLPGSVSMSATHHVTSKTQ